MKRALLLNPPAPGRGFIREGRCQQAATRWNTVWPPLSLATCAAILLNRGWKVSLHDAPREGMGPQEVAELAEFLHPDLVLFSSSTPTLEFDLQIPWVMKSRGVRAIFGTLGVHATALASETLEACVDLDFVLRGEPEQTLSEVAALLEAQAGLKPIPGLSYRTLEGEIQEGEDREPLEDLDDLPFPAWHLLDRGLYRLPLVGRPFLMAAPGRGCPYPCRFCIASTYYGKKPRTRSPESFVRELQRNSIELGVRDFLFWSETFTLDKEQVKGICEEIRRKGLRIRWACSCRVDTVDKDLLQRMRKAGCWMVSFGIESASQEVLDRADKRQTLAQTEQAIRLARSAGLLTTGHVMVGLPGDTVESIQETLRFVTRSRLDFAQFYCAVPWPGSELYRDAVDRGWLATHDWTLYQQERAIMEWPHLRRQDIEGFAHGSVKRFYMRPGRLLRLARWWLAGPGGVLER